MSNQHVVYNQKNNVWQVKKEESDKATKNFNTQLEAIKVAKGFAKNQEVELVIHQKKNGQIREKNSYGNDPFPPRG